MIRGPDPISTGANCKECPFSKNGQPHRPILGEGTPNARFIVLGEGPGGNELIFGRPFVGKSGAVVNEALKRARTDRTEVWVGNATLCRPTPNATPAMKERARRCCEPRLQAELAQFPLTTPVIALGGVAMHAFLPKEESIAKVAGATFKVDERLVVPSIHPAAFLRGGSGVKGLHAPDLGVWNLWYDVGKIAALTSGRMQPFAEDISYYWQPWQKKKAENDILRMLVEIERVGSMALDTETMVLDEDRYDARQPYKAELTAFGIATTERAVSASWDLWTPLARKRLRQTLANPTIEKVAHNRIYDDTVCYKNGFPIDGKFDCTILLHHAAFPGLAHDLQRVSTQFFSIRPWKAEFRDQEETPEEHVRYNAVDTLTCARLKPRLQVLVKKSQTEELYKVDNTMAEIASRMHFVGMPISREVNEELRVQFTKGLSEARAKINEKVWEKDIFDQVLDRLSFEQAKKVRKHDLIEVIDGVRYRAAKNPTRRVGKVEPMSFDERKGMRLDSLYTQVDKGKFEWKPGSSAHLVAYFKARGVAFTKMTKKGQISTTKEVWESLSHIPEVAQVLDYKENSKMLGTFVKQFFDRFDADGNQIVWGLAEEDSRIHPVWNVHRITGRWSSWRPGAQNWPKGNKKGRPNLRRQVVAPKGRKLVGFDAAQLEARIIALMSGDPFLVAIFQNKCLLCEGAKKIDGVKCWRCRGEGMRDIHTEFALALWPDFGTRDEKERKELRDAVKRPEYGCFYGGAVETLWRNIVKDFPKMTLQQVAFMVNMIKKNTPGLQRWHHRLIQEAAKPPYEIKSAILGRRRCYPLGNAEMTEVFNFPVQSTGADIINIGLAKFWQRSASYNFYCWPIVHVHDAVGFEVDEDKADKVMADVVDCFSAQYTVDGVTIDFPVEAKVADNWADL